MGKGFEQTASLYALFTLIQVSQVTENTLKMRVSKQVLCQTRNALNSQLDIQTGSVPTRRQLAPEVWLCKETVHHDRETKSICDSSSAEVSIQVNNLFFPIIQYSRRNLIISNSIISVVIVCGSLKNSPYKYLYFNFKKPWKLLCKVKELYRQNQAN